MNLLRLLQLTFRLIQVRQAQSRFRSRESSVQAASKTKEEQFPRITFHKKPLRVLIRTSMSEKSGSGNQCITISVMRFRGMSSICKPPRVRHIHIFTVDEVSYAAEPPCIVPQFPNTIRKNALT